MTRFWITLQQGVDFVMNNFQRMKGGEIFVPKLPSVRITDLATAMAPQLEQEIIGIRPGEKLHEVMCPCDDSYHTFEFDDFFIIGPTINFNNRNNDFSVTASGEKGTMVAQGFEYNSRDNADFLTVEQLKELNSKVVLE